MKKILLFMAAALIAVSADAQLASKRTDAMVNAHQKALPQTTIKNYQVVAERNVGQPVFTNKLSKQLKVTSSMQQSVTPAGKFTALRAGGRESGLQSEYTGFGNHVNDEVGSMTWTMSTGTITFTDETTADALVDVIPNPFTGEDFEDGVWVEYKLEGNTLTIEPQLVASATSSSTGEPFYIFLESATTTSGAITMTLKDDGSIDGSYSILYGAYDGEDYATANYLGYYGNYLKGIKYYLPGVIPVPAVSCETDDLVLFAGLGLNGYSYNNNLAFTSANAPLTFHNSTTDPATEWSWSATNEAEEGTAVTGNSKDFTLDVKANDIFTAVTLIGTNLGQASEPYVWATGKSFAGTGEPNYTEAYLYGGGMEGEFMLNNETTAIITRQDPDGDVTFYTNWATPDKASNSMNKIYIYHEKPAAPLYIEGVTLPLVSFTATDDFNLHIRICEASRNGTKLTVGNLLAEADATKENINDAFTVGLTGVEFTDLYRTDDLGMAEELTHLFLDTEFVIIIDGWNNETFTGVLGSQDAPDDNARTSTWFEKKGEDGSMYSYTSWKTSLFVGLLGATWGYLDTNDNTDLTIPAEGGQAKIHIEPMLRSVDNETGTYSTRLFLDDTVEDNEIPDWLDIYFDNEVYTDNESSYDLVFEAGAATENRSATMTFFQEGARLQVTVSQSAGSGVSAVVNKIDNNAPAYNAAGQRVGNDFRGLVVKDGKKAIKK